MNSAEIHAEVTDCINKGTIISDKCARAIAYNWMAPGTAISAFAHGFEVRAFEFHSEVQKEITDNDGPLWDLMALSDYIENVGIKA